MKRSICCLAAVLSCLLLVACSSAPSGDTSATPGSQSTNPRGKDRRAALKKLQKGMTTEAVRALLGEPDRVTVLEAPNGPGELWMYRSVHNAGARHIQTGTTTYQREHPLTGQLETVTEPIYSVETVYVETETTLIVRDGVLVDARQESGESRRVN